MSNIITSNITTSVWFQSGSYNNKLVNLQGFAVNHGTNNTIL